MINLNNTYYKEKKEKNKHLTKEMYDKIQSEYNHYSFSKNNTMKKTEFKRYLANLIGTTLSNIYEIINSGLITVLNPDLTERIEFSAELAWNKRTKKSIESNSSKRITSKPFIELVINEFRSEYNINSIDEIINDLKHNRSEEIQGMTTICTATPIFDTFIKKCLLDLIKSSFFMYLVLRT